MKKTTLELHIAKFKSHCHWCIELGVEKNSWGGGEWWLILTMKALYHSMTFVLSIEKKKRWCLPTGSMQRESVEKVPGSLHPWEPPIRSPEVCQIRCLALRSTLLDKQSLGAAQPATSCWTLLRWVWALEPFKSTCQIAMALWGLLDASPVGFQS